MGTETSPEPISRGLIQIFTGNGRGKTSAALGIILRAVGQGLRVCVVVFMKGDYPYSEWKALSKLPDTKIIRFGLRTFVDPANVKPEEIEEAKRALAIAREVTVNGDYNLVVLDEINIAAAWKLIDVNEVVRLVQDKPPNVELILTGRHADAKLIELADLVTECLEIKHPFNQGLMARKGIDY